jgi:hypothetical protein
VTEPGIGRGGEYHARCKAGADESRCVSGQAVCGCRKGAIAGLEGGLQLATGVPV